MHLLFSGKMIMLTRNYYFMQNEGKNKQNLSHNILNTVDLLFIYANKNNLYIKCHLPGGTVHVCRGTCARQRRVQRCR